jgi:hypothetical protein
MGNSSPYLTGCIVCGQDLIYRTTADDMTCLLCGVRGRTPAACPAGHYVCDRCHAETARARIELHCMSSGERDPVALATALMELEGVPMHGPEHHFLVAAALLTAHCNVAQEYARIRAWLAEARRRAEAVPGGFCGFQGACGAGVGTGIYASIVSGATPLAAEAWGKANRTTARSLDIIGRVGGPRCCKRTTWLAILAAARGASEAFGVEILVRSPRCEFHARNAQCLHERCPFFAREARRANVVDDRTAAC